MAKCLKCHGPVADTDTICSGCNPARLATPARTQFHGTMFVILAVLAVVGAIFGGRIFGPADAESSFEVRVVDQYRTDAEAVTAVVEVTNQGERASGTSCRVRAIDAAGSLIVATQVDTDVIGVHESIEVEADLRTAEAPDAIEAACS